MHYHKYTRYFKTKYFSNLGKEFENSSDDPSKQRYCPFEPTSIEYENFWDECEYYIKNGFYVESQRIAGLHYLYLNFCPIWNKKKRKFDFPDFRSLDADWFLNIEDLLGLGPNGRDPLRPVGQTDAKTRQAGHSLKAMVPALYYTHWLRGTKTYLGSYLEAHYKKTLNMFFKYSGHLAKYTDFGQPIAKKDSNKRYEFGYFESINGQDVLSGIQTSLDCVTFKDNPDKGVGGGCDLFIIEEAGLHPELDISVQYITDACVEGDETTGNILVFGAAGSIKSKVYGKMHYNPKDYRFKEYDNVWDENPIIKKTGYFIPNYAIRILDEDGNPDEEAGIISRDKKLESLKKNDYKNYVVRVSQEPNTPKEMFDLQYKRRFSSKPIENAIARILISKDFGESVDIWQDPETKKIIVKNNDKSPINDYPCDNIDDKEGTFVIYERPPINCPDDLFIAAIDSYNQEESTTNSFGSFFIYKKVHNLNTEGTHSVIVAEYFGRPQRKHTMYEILRCALIYYNAKCLVENEDTELVPWFINENADYLLADQPDIIRQYIPGSTVKRLKGIHAHIDLIIASDNKIDRYLTEKIGTLYNEKGEVERLILGVDRIPSLGLLRELLAYIRDPDINFDRVRSFGWVLMYLEETRSQKADNTNIDKFKMLVSTSRFYQ